MVPVRKWITPESEIHWLEMRSKDLTSTDVAALFGISPYLTEFELFHRKRGGITAPFEKTERVKWGSRLESSIAMGVAEEKGWRDVVPFKDYARLPEYRVGSSFDYYRTEAVALMEIKNVDGLQYARKWIDDGINLEAPPHIELQVQHQMLVSGVPRCCICALVGGNELVVIERDYNPSIGQAILFKAERFWHNIELNKEPQIDFEKDAAFIKELYSHAEPNKMIPTSADINEQAMLYKTVSMMIKELEKAKEGHKAHLLRLIGDAETVKSDAFTISAGLVGPTEYVVKRQGYRNFRITWKAGKDV